MLVYIHSRTSVFAQNGRQSYDNGINLSRNEKNMKVLFKTYLLVLIVSDLAEYNSLTKSSKICVFGIFSTIFIQHICENYS